MKNLEHLTLDELFAEGKRLHGEMGSLTERLSAVYTVMYSRARRNPDALTPAYLNIANAGKRLAGMMAMGLKRTSSFDRQLTVVKKDAEEAAKDVQIRQAAKDARASAKAGKAVVVDPFFDMFGPDVMGRAPVETELVEPSDVSDLYGEEV